MRLETLDLDFIIYQYTITPTEQEDVGLNIKQNLKGDVMVLNLSGKIMGGPDHDKFQTEIKTLISAGHVDILLDMHKVSWVNSTGLGILVSAYHTLKKNGGQLKICQVSPGSTTTKRSSDIQSSS